MLVPGDALPLDVDLGREKSLYTRCIYITVLRDTCLTFELTWKYTG